ncbi:MAG: chloride channel protein [Gammaproteobacteria bacterium]|nr:chloride channel protein [Gammaproteobacteria bacterium]
MFKQLFSLQGLRRTGESKSSVRHLPLLSLLAALVAVLATGLVIAFRLVIEWSHNIILGVTHTEINDLLDWQRFLIPLCGAGLVALTGYLLKVDGRMVGTSHVMYRSRQDNPKMPSRNALMQFIGGGIALSSGSPGGWLGPSMHIGATGSSMVYRHFDLPDDSIRTLLAAGVAAAITACIDTPIAGLVLACEVVLLQFRILSFVPVMLAAGISSVIMYVTKFPPLIAFPEFHSEIYAITDFLIILPAGIVLGLFSAGFNYSIEITSTVRIENFTIRCLIVGLVVGIAAWLWPSLMGSGFEVFNFGLAHWQSWTLLALTGYILLKLMLVSVSVGFGMPVGIMGPSLVTGAVFGVLMYKAVGLLMPGAELPSLAFYMLIGACAMFSTVLNAPLAALITVLELSGEPKLMFPAMLLIVVANLTSALTYGQNSVFASRLRIMREADRANRQEI